MILGFSLSPGGLLLPYHLGALAALAYHGYITDSTPLAGSSAGAIAVASHASGVPCLRALDASIRVSSKCWNPLFVPTGGLLPCLRHELDQLLPQDAHARLNDRKGIVALAHRELFPTNQAVMKTHFDTRNCLLDSVCDSSTFPYFLTNQPARVVQRKNKIVPRIVVDGVFACPLERIGCPEFSNIITNHQEVVVDRTVTISVFPKQLLKLSKSRKEDKIGPDFEPTNALGQTSKLIRMATQGSTARELANLYESGWADAERWAVQEDQRQKAKQRAKRAFQGV